MADQQSVEASCSSGASGESSETIVELNIKTLDSQIYSFHVNKNMPVSSFKEKIANEIGVPIGLQRLIFRGKVLKDDHLLSEYHVENGHTLHLVARQPAQSQPSPSTSSGEANGSDSNRGNDATAGGPRNRIGQVSHSVVLGTFNIGEQGEGVVPDLNRVIGAVLNSFGIGGQTAANGIGGSQLNVQALQGNETEGTRGSVGGQSQAGNQTQGVRATIPMQSLPQVMQIPLLGSSLPVPSPQTPIPDSLNTLSEFMLRMEQALSNNGYQPNSSSTNVGHSPAVELPSVARGSPMPEALSIVLRHAQRLLNGHASAALSHIAGRLEQEGDSTDPTTRAQIQTESTQVGFAMQHLGALLLELGRTILTLRMGQSPAESFVNAGPAVYISPLGPNPIMVQPFPLQTSSLFGGPAVQPPNPIGLVGLGDVPRHVNIHIHAGTALAPIISAVGARTAGNGEGSQGERGNGAGSTDSGTAQILPVRNVIAAAIPSRPTGVAAASMAQPSVSVSQAAPDSVSLSTIVAEVNSRIRNLVDNMRGENLVSSGSLDSATPQNPYGQSDSSNDVGGGQSCRVGVGNAGVAGVSSPAEEGEGQKEPGGREVGNGKDALDVLSSNDVLSSCSIGEALSCSGGETTLNSVDASGDAPKLVHSHTSSENSNVPLGLGLGGLQSKRRSRLLKPQGKNGDGGTSSIPPFNQNQSARASGQQLLQSLASGLLTSNRADINNPSSGQVPPLFGQVMEGLPVGGQGPDGQFDASNMMSQVLRSPALNGMLAGVSEQTGVGSPDVLRNMLEQFTQSPLMRNAVNQIAEQVDNQVSGLGRGQGGGIDLSRMVQQMMPVVCQALTSGSAISEPFAAVQSEPVSQYNERSPSGVDKPADENSQIDLQHVAWRIERLNPPGEVFRAMVENAVRLSGNRSHPEDLVEELCRDECLASEFMGMLEHDISQRLEDKRRSEE